MTMGEMEDDMEDIEMTMSDEEYLADLENKAMTANAKHYQHIDLHGNGRNKPRGGERNRRRTRRRLLLATIATKW